jgi:hypothetical protein
MDTATITTGTREQRRYTDAEQAQALAILTENNGNCAVTSRVTGIPERTIRSWKTGQIRPVEGTDRQELAVKERAERAERWGNVLDQALDVVEEKLPEASARDAAVIAGIASEKHLLLRGEATSITETRDDSRIRALAERYGRLHTVTPLPVATHGPDGRPLPAPQAESTGNAGESGGESGT